MLWACGYRRHTSQLIVSNFTRFSALRFGTKVGTDQLGLPVRVGPTRIKSDRLGSLKTQQQLDEIETFNHLKGKIRLKIGPNQVNHCFTV